MRDNKIRVCILGGGIGGLAAAHQLSKYPDKFHIDIYERNHELGGLARTTVNDENKHSEYAWHAIGIGYFNFLTILNEIENSSGVKVISHLKPLKKFIYALEDKCYIENGISFLADPKIFFKGFENLYGHPASFKEKLGMATLLFKSFHICEDRLNSYSEEKWSSELKDASDDLKQAVNYFTTLYLGMNSKKLSKRTIYKLLRNTSTNSDLLENIQNNFYCFDGPMNTIFFDVWAENLEKMGVNIFLDTEVLSMYSEKNLIYKISIDTKYHKDIELEYDIFINALDCKNLYKLYPKCSFIDINNDNKNLTLEKCVCDIKCDLIKEQKNKFKMLYENSSQLQSQILYYLDYRLQSSEVSPTILILPNTPWMIMIRIEGELWETKGCDYISAAIGVWDVAGSYIEKSARQCTKEELAEECWDQIYNSQHNLKLEKEYPEWDMWYSFEFDEENKEIITYEPKFSNNVGTFDYRPDIRDKIFNNLYHSVAYARTSANIYNMESAAEAGISVGNLIISELEENIKNDNKIINYTIQPNITLFQRFCRWLDHHLFYPVCG